MSTYYTANVPSVASETLDKETIIISFTTGLYYHTGGVGAEIWKLMEHSISIDGVVQHLTARYSGDPEQVAVEALSFVEALERESLIVPSQDLPSRMPCACSDQATEIEPFSSPVLNVYTDMAELLLLDPVHEIEDRSEHSVENLIP